MALAPHKIPKPTLPFALAQPASKSFRYSGGHFDSFWFFHTVGRVHSSLTLREAKVFAPKSDRKIDETQER